MPEFHLIQNIVAPLPGPTKCVFCGDFAGPFINTNVEIAGYGHLYICAPNERTPGCTGQIAVKAGYVPGQQLADLTARMEAERAELADIRQERDDLLQLKEITAIVRQRQERKLQPQPNGDVTPEKKPPRYTETVTFTGGGTVGKRP